MKFKIDMIDVIKETMSKFPLVDIYTSKFLMGKNNYTFICDDCGITMPICSWEYLIGEFLLKKGFEDGDVRNTKLKIINREKLDECNGFSNSVVVIETAGWSVPGVKFIT